MQSQIRQRNISFLRHIYEGEWSDDQFQGKEVIKYERGDIYEG